MTAHIPGAPVPGHTPTPWEWWSKDYAPHPRPKNYDLAHLYGANGDCVLTMYGGAGNLALGKSPEDIANAAFIVLACNAHADLLAACQLMVGSLGALEEERGLKMLGLSVDAMNAAIAKAEGTP